MLDFSAYRFKRETKNTHQFRNFRQHAVIAMIPFNKMISFSRKKKLLSIFHKIHIFNLHQSIDLIDFVVFQHLILCNRDHFHKTNTHRYTHTRAYTVTVISAIRNKYYRKEIPTTIFSTFAQQKFRVIFNFIDSLLFSLCFFLVFCCPRSTFVRCSLYFFYDFLLFVMNSSTLLFLDFFRLKTANRWTRGKKTQQNVLNVVTFSFCLSERNSCLYWE